MIDPTVLRQLCEQAQPEPWSWTAGGQAPPCVYDGTGDLITDFKDDATAELVVALRNNIIPLLDENAALRAKTEEMQRWIDHHNERADKAESRLAALREAGEKVVAEIEEFDSALVWDSPVLDAFKAELRSDP